MPFQTCNRFVKSVERYFLREKEEEKLPVPHSFFAWVVDRLTGSTSDEVEFFKRTTYAYEGSKGELYAQRIQHKSAKNPILTQLIDRLDKTESEAKITTDDELKSHVFDQAEKITQELEKIFTMDQVHRPIFLEAVKKYLTNKIKFKNNLPHTESDRAVSMVEPSRFFSRLPSENKEAKTIRENRRGPVFSCPDFLNLSEHVPKPTFANTIGWNVLYIPYWLDVLAGTGAHFVNRGFCAVANPILNLCDAGVKYSNEQRELYRWFWFQEYALKGLCYLGKGSVGTAKLACMSLFTSSEAVTFLVGTLFSGNAKELKHFLSAIAASEGAAQISKDVKSWLGWITGGKISPVERYESSQQSQLSRPQLLSRPPSLRSQCASAKMQSSSMIVQRTLNAPAVLVAQPAPELVIEVSPPLGAVVAPVGSNTPSPLGGEPSSAEKRQVSFSPSPTRAADLEALRRAKQQEKRSSRNKPFPLAVIQSGVPGFSPALASSDEPDKEATFISSQRATPS